jgi:hypothetical protein
MARIRAISSRTRFVSNGACPITSVVRLVRRSNKSIECSSARLLSAPPKPDQHVFKIRQQRLTSSIARRESMDTGAVGSRNATTVPLSPAVGVGGGNLLYQRIGM